MRLPVIHGLIRRRLLINYRIDAEVAGRFLPPPFRPKLHNGYAIAGICLIRLEEIRPGWLPRICGISSENAAHRFAVLWEEPLGQSREGVYIPRRDTGSLLSHLAGGRVFPGEHQLADFDVTDDGSRIAMTIRARDGEMAVELRALECATLPETSCFRSLAESSAFFESGGVGYSVTRDCCRLDGIRLVTDSWQVRPLSVEHVVSSFFADESVFPAGSVTFDHALIMRDICHEWHGEADMVTERAANKSAR
ncbi:MAG TPA: DUF2071 domain-containing protein [Luteolibacter sp.]